MLSNDSANDPATSPRYGARGAKAGAAGVSVAILNPRSTVEVASQPSGPVNDPPASDNKPPSP